MSMARMHSITRWIMADPYDTTDHYQDGYYTVPFDRFFSMWREGAAPEGRELWQQPFIVAAPAQDQASGAS